VDQKKAAELAPLNQTLIAPDGSNPASTILELDELWSFVTKKTNQAWIWIALCRQTRQVVAYAIGDRSQSTCRRLWQAIPAAYRAGHCFTDFWAAYQTVIPEEQHLLKVNYLRTVLRIRSTESTSLCDDRGR
jgi:insertion element IS1 protein InsB